MPLRLTFVPSVAPLLRDLLAPVIRRHIGFKRRDSFRVVVPDGESRQDLESFFLQDPSLGGVLIGKSLLTLAGLAQHALLRHPAPLPLASEPLAFTCLRQALQRHFPAWNLDPLQLRECLRALRRLERLDSLSVKNQEGRKVLREYRQILESRGKAWTLERSYQEAWKSLGLSPSPDLAEVKDFYFLGFLFPEPALTGALQALLKNYPDMNIHLFLPPEEEMLDSEARLEPWLQQMRSWATEQESLRLEAPPMEIQPFPTPVHEDAERLERWSRDRDATRLLLPGGATLARMARQIAPWLPPRESEENLRPEDSQVAGLLLSALAAGRDLQAELSFEELCEQWQPVFVERQRFLAQAADLDSLRLLEAYRQRVREWSQAARLDSLSRPLQAWLEMLKQDFAGLRLVPPSASPLSPLRRLGRGGFIRRPTLLILGLNEGIYPRSSGPAFFEEAGAQFFDWQEARLAFRQSLYLAENFVSLSYSRFSVSGRPMGASPFLAELTNVPVREPLETLFLPRLSSSPYFEENIRRENRRHFSKNFGEDSGNLSSLDLEKAMLEKLSKKPLSATYLDDYAKCPWRFFAKWHLRLEEEPEEDLEMNPRNRGKLLHRLLEKIFQELTEAFFSAGKIPSLEEIHACLAKPFENLSREIMEMPSPLPLALRRDALDRIRQSVLGLLEIERQEWSEAPQQLLPRHFEWSFGRAGSPALEFALDSRRSVPLTGSVDRIDVNASAGHFLLIDYKSSRSGELAQSVREGRSLQLWIYGEAVRRLLYPQAEGLGGLYWNLKELDKNQGMARREALQPYRQKKIHANSLSFMKEEAFAALQKRLEDSLRDILMKILAGDYGLQPAECLGSRCEFHEICRYDDQPR